MGRTIDIKVNDAVFDFPIEIKYKPKKEREGGRKDDKHEKGPGKSVHEAGQDRAGTQAETTVGKPGISPADD